MQLVGLSSKRRRRGELGFRDAAWAAGSLAAGTLPLIALREADCGAVVAWARRGWLSETSRLGAAACHYARGDSQEGVFACTKKAGGQIGRNPDHDRSYESLRDREG
jgi:hypothetical protein